MVRAESGTGSAASSSRTATRSSWASRNERPLTRCFPELLDLRAQLPERCVVDGEIVIVGPERLEFDQLPAAPPPPRSRVNRLAAETPADFVAFDLLALGDRDLTGQPFFRRRAQLEEALTGVTALHLTRTTTDRDEAEDWFQRFEGAGLDGVMPKPADGLYVSDKRVQFKVKHQRTADCVVAGYRMHKSGDGVGSLLLGLWSGDGPDADLRHVGVAASFTAKRRVELLDEIAPYGSTPASATPGRSGSSTWPRPRRRARSPAASAAGTLPRTCPGTRCGPSSWSR